MLVGEAIFANLTSSRALQQNLFSLLQNCNSIKKLTQIHTQIIINGFSQKNFILVKLLSLYISSGYTQNAPWAFQQMENPSTAVWNQMIRWHAWNETPSKALHLYNQMRAAEAVPDGFTYSFVISACARYGLLKEGKQLHGKVISNGFSSNLFVQTNLVNLYAAAGEVVANASSVFDEMAERNVVTWNSLLVGYLRSKGFDAASRVFDAIPEKNVISWTTMISGCVENGKYKQALSLFHEMQRADIELDQVAMVATLSACAELGDLKLGRWIHSYIVDNFCSRNQPVLVSLSNALIHMYASCGMMEESHKIFRELPQRTSVSWTSMIMGFAKQGRGEEALQFFHCMQHEVRPDEITLLGVLCACSHSGFVNEGRYFFKSMNPIWGIEPKIKHYGCIVDLLSRAGFLDEAYRLVQTMPIKPNDSVWGAILGGCRIHKNVVLASHIAQKLVIELDPDRAADYLVLLANMYADNKRWQDAADVREKIVAMGVKKPLGRSWVQIDGVIHDFIVEDRTHKHAYSAYKVLGEITTHAKGEENNIDCIEFSGTY